MKPALCIARCALVLAAAAAASISDGFERSGRTYAAGVDNEKNHYILCPNHRCTYGGMDRWTVIGPDGAAVTAIAVDPVTPSTAFAATVGSGILKSVDSG